MAQVAEFLHRAVQISLNIQKELGGGKVLLKDFIKVATEGDSQARKDLEQLSKDVEAFATKFPLPGVVSS